MATANDILKTAIAELGVKESPANSNRVKYNTWYYGKVVSGEAYPWCMVFVQWVFNQAGAKSLLPAVTASCTALRDAAKPKGLWVTSGYQPGDLVIYDWNDDTKPDHVGIFEKWTGKTTFTAIEGNTSTSSDSNGGEVMRRSRSTEDVHGAVRPKYTAAASSTLDGAVYTVAKGDTLAKIASKYGVTYQELAKWNGINNPNSISVGQAIFVTEAAAAVGKLGKLGVLNSPDYWQQQVIKNTYSFRPLFVKSAAKITRAGTRTASAELGIQALVAAGIMDSPDYWRKAVAENKVSGLQSLLCALGGAVR